MPDIRPIRRKSIPLVSDLAGERFRTLCFQLDGKLKLELIHLELSAKKMQNYCY
nr:unnamed protein product [Callosobruchus analis]